MSVRKNILWLILFVLVFTSFGMSIGAMLSAPKIAFVNSSVVIEKYVGLIEVRKVIEERTIEWNRNVDTLEARYNKDFLYLKNNRSKLKKDEIEKLEQGLSKKAAEYSQYKYDIQQRLSEENDKLTQGALNQVNSFIETYAKENDIDIVIGVTLSGNVLYGSSTIDLTDVVVDGLNKTYR